MGAEAAKRRLDASRASSAPTSPSSFSTASVSWTTEGERSGLPADGKPLAHRSSIWVCAPSEADLPLDSDVFGLRDLPVSNTSEDFEELRRVLADLIVSSEVLAVGKNHLLLLPSARFKCGRTEMSERIGLDYRLPPSEMLPIEPHVRWVEEKRASAKVAGPV
jgi:hypothetical protein